ncbi:MAG: GGDEF-domain containing protein, partial [Arcobacteraceae bacterium]
MFKTLKNFIFSINVALVTVLFLIIFSFATYLHTTFIEKEAVRQANIISNQVFSSMFQVMKRGWTRTELNDFTNSLKKNFNTTNYSINIHRGGSVNELFGFVTESQKDSMVLEAFKNGEQITIFKDDTLRNI